MFIAIIAISIIVLIIIIIIVVASSDGGHSFKSNGSFYNNNIDIDNIKAPKLDNINKSKDQQEFGIAGENRVANMLKRIQKNYKSYIFNDFTFKDDDGHSANIDHIFVCKGGVFIIETKTFKGKIYGTDSDVMWTQKKEWNENKQFKNPVKQNEGHINHLKRMFKYNPPKMYSLIIFPTDADLKNVNSIYVHDMNSAFLFIIDKIEEEKYDEQFINRINNELKDIIDQYGITIEEHKQNINNKYTYKQ